MLWWAASEAPAFEQMTILAQLPEIIGFFSYAREDDLDSEGALSALRKRIQSELRAQLGRSEKTLRLFQDAEAIAPGTLWETQLTDAICKCSFFIPIVTPRVVQSKYCRLEFQSFMEREKALRRADLVFPIIYIEIPELKDEKYWRGDPVLSCIGQRQYVDWSDHRFELDTPRFRRETALFARTIVHALKRETERFVSDAEERRPQEELDNHKIALDTDESLTRPAAKEKTQTEVTAIDGFAKATPTGAEQIASRSEAQRAPKDTNPPRLRTVVIAAMMLIFIALIGVSYRLLARGEDQSVARNKGVMQENSEPKVSSQKSTNIRDGTDAKAGQGSFEQRDNTEATAAYEKAADAGDTAAMVKLGWIYQNGRDGIHDYDKAKQYYRRAADLGDADAVNYLGALYENGLGVTRDYGQAKSLYEKSVQAGNADGLRNLGSLYERGRGVSQDYYRARSLYEQAKSLYEQEASSGNAEAMTNLARLYESGRGVAMDYDKAKSLYEKAVLAGNAQAMNNLGQMYENARGTWQDYTKAKSLYEQAAAAGNQEATLNLTKVRNLEKLNAPK